MAQTNVDVKVDVKGLGDLNKLNTAFKKTEKAVEGATNDIAKFSKSGQKIKTAANGLEYFTDKAGRARKVTGQFVTTAERAAAGIDRVGNASQRATGKVGGLGQSIRGVVKGLALLQAGRFIFGKTAEIERTTKQLATVTGSLQTAKGILADLQVINKKSPFSFIELADTAKRLSAFGIANKDLVGTTERLGKAAAATGARVNELSLAYGQVAAKGKLQTEELYQFQERGIPLLDELAKGYGKTNAEVQDLISKGRVGFPAVEQAIKNLTTGNGKFAKSFENTADTLDAKLSNAIDSLGRAAAAFGELLKPTVIEALLKAEEILTGITGFLKAIPAPAAKVALQFGAVAAQVFIANKALKLLVGFKAGIAATLAATSGGLTAAGTAAKVANPFLFKSKALLLSLAKIGFITIGVNIIINGLEKLAALEKRFANIAGVSSNDFGQLVGGSALSKQEIDKLVKENRDAVQKKTDELGGIRFPFLTGKDDALKGEILQLEARYAKLRTMRERAIYGTPQDRAAADLKRNGDPFKLGDFVGGNDTKGGGASAGAGAAAKAERERQRALEEAQRLAESQREAYTGINQELDRSIALNSGVNDYIKQGLQNQFEYEDVVKRINTEVAAGRQAELIALAQLKKDQADFNVLKGAATDFGSDMGEFFADKLPEANDELTKTEQLLKSSFEIVSGSLTSGIQGLIDGTKEWGDVLSDIASQLGSMFLNAAFSSLGAGLKIPGFAEGGRPEANRLSIVGERGPELFVPDAPGTVLTNDQAFDAARGAMSGSSPSSSEAFAENTNSISTTNSYMRERSIERENQISGGGASSMVIETQVINSVEYATIDQVQKASAASAKQARAQVFNDMKNKPSRRAMVGLK